MAVAGDLGRARRRTNLGYIEGACPQLQVPEAAGDVSLHCRLRGADVHVYDAHPDHLHRVVALILRRPALGARGRRGQGDRNDNPLLLEHVEALVFDEKHLALNFFRDGYFPVHNLGFPHLRVRI